MKKLFGLLTVVTVLAACAEAKPILRTVDDAARVACEAAFGTEQLPQGLTVKDLCEAHADLEPFIKSILSAKQAVGAVHGMKPKE